MGGKREGAFLKTLISASQEMSWQASSTGIYVGWEGEGAFLKALISASQEMSWWVSTVVQVYMWDGREREHTPQGSN